MSIEQQIAVALVGRKAQREFVGRLSHGWEDLADTWAALVAAADGMGASAAAARSPDRAEASVFSDLARYLAVDAGWRERAAAASDQMREATGLVRTLQQRVNRETVNIGVIGQTHAGKSTLLRKLTGLGEDHIPSNRFSSTTATPSRIFHDPGSGPGRAVLTLHTWESFRAELLAPLHRAAEIPGEPPASLEDFRRFPGYRIQGGQIAEGKAGPERYRRRLQLAQDSLPSYQNLLRGGTREITSLDQLRSFVAYPTDEDPRADYRPYHAVRSVDIFCPFPEVGAVSLGLVDLPGAGEAGLDVHGRFLTDLRHHADVLFIVKRPEMAPVTDPDWDARELADKAAGGVRRSDFAHQVVNRDARVPQEHFAKALARTRADSEQLGIDVRVCDIESSSPAEVADAILSPLLAILAERLAYMDRDAAEHVLSDLTKIAAEIQSLAGELADWIEGREGELPDQEDRLRRRARELRNDVGLELERVRNEYDALHETGVPIAELHEEIEKAGRDMQQWLAGGLGAGSRQEWLTTFRAAEAVRGHGQELDERYNGARKQVVSVFGGIDASLARAVERLWGEVAAALRVKLTEAIVPAGKDNQAILSEFAGTARRSGARTVAGATDRLLNLPTEYGSIFLRVGRPIVRKIEWDKDGGSQQLASDVAAAAGAGLMAGAAGGLPAGAAAAAQQFAGSETLSTGVRRAPWRVQGEPGQREEQGSSQGGSWRDSSGGAGTSPVPGSSAGSRAAPAPQASPASAVPAGTGGESREFARAAKWYAGLSSTVEQVTGELKEAFHKEAQQTLSVLAAAVDLFKDTATSTPGIEREFEKLAGPVQREIWKEDLRGDAAKIAADLAVLQKRATEADGAAAQVSSLAAQARRL